MTLAYDRYAADYAACIEATLAPAAERLAELAGAQPGLRLLDVATGTGIAARAAASRGAAVVGVDSSHGMLAVAGDLSRDVDFQLADAGNLPFGDGAFDAVTCGLSLSHFPELEAALGEIRRVLRPGGCFVASAWGEGSRFPTRAVGELLDRYAGPSGKDVLDEETWLHAEQGTSVLRRAGFPEVSVTSESFDGGFADAEEALAWALGWPLTAARLRHLEPTHREQFRRESLQALGSSSLTWSFAFNFYLARKSSARGGKSQSALAAS